MTLVKRGKRKEESLKKIAVYFTLFLLSSFFFPLSSHAATADLSITQQQISFSTQTFYAGDTVRIYGRVRNLGEVDMTATVYFYQGPAPIGAPQSISMQAGGAIEEVFVDFTVPNSAFNIRAVIQGADPTDENSLNNEATTPLYTPIADDDRDSVSDATDNCRTASNADQADTDHDGQGNACDTDDDNDGLSDAAEVERATDPQNPDSDGDGVNDKTDAAPTNAATSTVPVAVPTVSPKNSATSSNETSSNGTLLALEKNTAGTDIAAIDEEVDADATPKPTFAFGIFGGRDADASPDAAVTQDEKSFFRLDNPWLLVLIGSGLLLVLAIIFTLILLRRKNRDV